MDNNQYSSLADKLIQNGIISSKNIEDDMAQGENFFEIKHEDNNFTLPAKEAMETKQIGVKNKKRINKYDLELLNENAINNEKVQNNSFKIIERFINFKQSMAQKGNIKKSEKFIFTFFPKLYRAKLAKIAINKLDELNIDAKTLLDKTIPYGESENRYQNLIKYLNFANEIQVKLRRKF